jgi:hypothetical protein
MDEALSNCEMCGLEAEPSGLLGRRIHYHCAACGWWWSALNENC